MADLPVTLTDRVAFVLRLALARAESMGEAALAERGVTGREYGLLALLEGGRAQGQGDLGRTLGLDRTTTMALLAGLEARGLVRRERDPADRRAYRVTLTRAGDRTRAQAATVLEGCDDAFLAPLSPAERRRLREALARLADG